jgi:futalosine hydrolase
MHASSKNSLGEDFPISQFHFALLPLSLIMNCLLVAATAPEIAVFLDHYRHTDKTSFVDINIDVLVTGVGLMATAYSLTRQFALRRPDLVIQAGIGGCFDKKIPLGSVLAVKQDTIADLAVIEQNELKTMFTLGLADPNQFPYTKGWLVNRDKGIFKRNKLKAVNAITINQVTTDPAIIKLYTKHFKPVVESMEGAALHYVCLEESVPFLQLRSISNYIGERNKAKWKMKDAIGNLNKELIRLLESL